jgi:hypothetical protein
LGTHQNRRALSTLARPQHLVSDVPAPLDDRNHRETAARGGGYSEGSTYDASAGTVIPIADFGQRHSDHHRDVGFIADPRTDIRTTATAERTKVRHIERLPRSATIGAPQSYKLGNGSPKVGKKKAATRVSAGDGLTSLVRPKGLEPLTF